MVAGNLLLPLTQMQKILFSVLFIVAVTLFIGCGPKGLSTAFVEGVVTLDGQPLGGALVTFVPETKEGGKAASGYADTAGVYHLTSEGGGLAGEGAVPGTYVVTVTKVEIKTIPGVRNPSDPPSVKPTESVVQTVITPKTYASAASSPLKVTVAAGKNTIPLELKK